VHFFDESTPLFKALASLAKLRHQWIALRRGRQYLHDISGDGEHFGMPRKLGERLLGLVAWSRVMGDHEMLVVLNTDDEQKQEMYATLNPNLRVEGDELELLFSYTPERGAESVQSPQYALTRATVERRGDHICARLILGPAGFAIYTTHKVLVPSRMQPR
jgi:hypothetical protein